MTPADIGFLLADNGLVLNIPTYDALIFGSDTDSRYTLRATTTTCSPSRSTPSGSGTSSPMTSSCTPCTATCSSTRPGGSAAAALGEIEAEAAAHAATIAQVVGTSTAFDDGNNPIFTLNAFAFSGEGDPGPVLSPRLPTS